MPDPKLITKAEYDALKPEQQGYVCYMQAAWPGSEIPDVNPHPKGSAQARAWQRGAHSAMLQAQDAD